MSDEELQIAVAAVASGALGEPADVPAVEEVRDSGVDGVPVPSGSGALTDYDNQLIAELVANMRPAAEILRSYGLTKDDLVAKARNPEWASRYKQINAQWNSDKNARDRIRAKAAFLLEDSLVPLAQMARSGTAQSRLGAIDRLIEISTVAHIPKDEGHMGEKTTITINYGGDKPVTVTKESANERTTAVIAADPASNS